MTNGDTEPEDDGITREHKLAGITLVLGLLVAGLIIWLVRSTLEDAAQIATIVGGVGALVLSLLGGAAGLWWFLERDPLRPRLNVEQEVVVLPGPKGMHLLQVFARLENVGEIPVEIRSWRIWICPLEPLPGPVSEVLLEHSACVDAELAWERCAGRRIEEKFFHEIRMRTGEIQEIIASVVVPKSCNVVRIHSFFPHPKLNKGAEDRGWTRYSIVRLKGESDG